jgi:hypothetical protein
LFSIDAGDGCQGGWLNVGIDALDPDASVLAPLPDAGPVPWVLVLSFQPFVTQEGGCPGACSDSFVAQCQKL